MTPPLNYKHACVEWDWAVIEPDSAEMEACICGEEDE